MFEDVPDSAQQQANCCCAVFDSETELHLHFILDQNGELIVTDEGEEVFDIDDSDELTLERPTVRETISEVHIIE